MKRYFRRRKTAAISSGRLRQRFLELVPPLYVAADLLNGASDPRAMPLDKFIAGVMDILNHNQPCEKDETDHDL